MHGVIKPLSVWRANIAKYFSVFSKKAIDLRGEERRFFIIKSVKHKYAGE